MAYFSITNWESVEKKIAYRVKSIRDAVDTVTAATGSLKSLFDGWYDDSAVGAALRAAVQTADRDLENLFVPACRWFAHAIARIWSDPDLSPRDDDGNVYASFDAWYTKVKSSLTNPILSNEVVELLRAVLGTAAVSPGNASAPAGTIYGTTTLTGSGSGTNSLEEEPVDVSLYCGGVLEGELLTDFPLETTFSLKGTTYTGEPWDGSVTIPANSSMGDTFEVTPATAKTYCAALTDVSITGGASEYRIQWQLKPPRTISA